MNKLDVLDIRNKLGLNQEDFGKLIGVSKNTVYNYENGAKIPVSKIPILQQYLTTKTLTIVSEPELDYGLKKENQDLKKIIAGKDKQITIYEKLIESLEEKVQSLEELFGIKKRCRIRHL